MITLEKYLMGRDKEYPLNEELLRNAADLIGRVNYLLGRLNIEASVSSGYRPGHFNTLANGATKSAHVTCQAVDLKDPHGKIGTLLVMRKEMLEKCGLWLENPQYTKKLLPDQSIVHWVHLDTKSRVNRIFNPR